MKEYGVPDIDVFQTVDLWEKKDIGQVTTTLYALGRTVSCSLFYIYFSILIQIPVAYRHLNKMEKEAKLTSRVTNALFNLKLTIPVP